MTSSLAAPEHSVADGALGPSVESPSVGPPSSAAPNHSRLRGPGARWLLGGLLLGGLFLVGFVPKQRARQALLAAAAEAAEELPIVAVIRPKPGKLSKTLSLPGDLKGREQAVLFARANGYVQRWLVDLGDRVEQGQLLAQLDTPELDREVEQGRAGLAESVAALNEARAGRDYGRVNLDRFRALAPAGVVSQGDLQKTEAEMQVAEAKLGVAEAARAAKIANLHRLEQLKSFARVSAPFDGIITARKVDRGMLVSAGSSALFELAAVEPLRVVVDVPQSLALGVKAGISGALRVRELPGRSFLAKLARSAGTLDAASRTMRVELEVSNQEQLLLPGMYAEVELEVERQHAALALPASAVISTKEGLRVATVDAAGVVHLKPIVIERDNGAEVEVADGLSASDSIVASPRPFLSEGARVKTAATRP
jgi:membrane fusion protein (multidrug efflux system)